MEMEPNDLDPDDFDPPSDASHSDSDDGEDADVDPRFHRVHNRIDERHHAADMIANCRIKTNATRAGVRAAVTDCEVLLEARSRNLKSCAQEFLADQHMLNLPQADAFLEKFDVTSPFKGWKTDPGQVNAIKTFSNYIPPASSFLGVRVDRINIGQNEYQLRPVRETFQFVSIKDILKMVARKESVMEYVRNLRPRPDDLLRTFTDGDLFKNHPFFQTFPDAFQMGFYYDDVETVNPVGSKTGTHMMAFFAVKILNAPPYLNSVFGGYHVIALAHKTDIDKYGFQPVLQNFIDDCRQLESDEGVEIFIGDQRVVQRACVCAVLGDTKAVHEVLGFLSASARHFCRLCMLSRPQLHNGIVLGEPRSAALHAVHLGEVLADPANSLYNGVKENSCLHQLRYFHSSQNTCFDTMHDLAEGVGAWEIKLVLKHFVCDMGYFRAVDLNRRIMAYNYGSADRRNKPTACFNTAGLRSALNNHNIVGTSAQTFCLLRVLPFLLDNLGTTPDVGRHLTLLLILQELVQIVRAPILSRALMPYLQDLVADHRRLFQELFPNLDPTNKHHHLEHYVDCILKMGPLEQYNCMRAEASMRPLKRHVVSCNSYRDVCKTAGEYAQIAQAMKWGLTTHPNVVPKFEFQSRKKRTSVHDCHLAATLNERGFDDDDVVHTLTAVSVYGREYLVNSFVIIRKRSQNPNNMEAFARIVGIIVANDDEDVWFELEEWETVHLHPRFNAYVVIRPRRQVLHLLDPFDLPQHPAISSLRDYSTENVYLPLRHIVV